MAGNRDHVGMQTADGDRLIDCSNCGTAFLWTAGEQEYYRDRDLKPPRRCKTCRFARQQARATAQAHGARVWE
jgi:hypothetical protein